MNKNFNNIKISVIIPSFNRIDYLQRSIGSVLKQTYTVNEIILVDNNSNDGTKEFVTNYYPEVKVHNEDKKGVSFARNTGIIKSKNEWIAFLDSDDEWCKKKIEMQINKLLCYGNKYRIIHTDEKWIKNGKYHNQKIKHKKKGGYLFNDSLEFCKISPSSVLMHKSLFEKYGMFDNNLQVCEDYELWLRITSKVLIGFVDEPLLIKYGGHKGQLSKKYWGLDRFRIQALENIILTFKLNPDQKYWAIKTMLKKIKILSNGAKKRKNYKFLLFLEKKEKNWSKELIYNAKTTI